jgi:hypothetical protein
MNINEVKKFFDYLYNKNQSGGYVTPTDFNMLATRATTEVVMDLYGNIKEYKAGRPIANIAYAMTQAIVDYMDKFIAAETMQLTTFNDYAVCKKPKDYLHYDAITVIGYQNGTSCSDGKVTYAPVQIVNNNQLGNKLKSLIVAPDLENPVGAFINDRIRIYPKECNLIEFIYLRKAVNPVWGFTITSGRAIYNPSTSTDIELPDEMLNTVVVKMLSYVGISIREGEMIQVAEMKDNKGM